jgi:toluene monooxygenase system ferredoxin subunit
MKLNDMKRIPICPVADVPVNGIKEIQASDGKRMCLINAGDRFFACQAACPHEGILLCDGVFDGETLTCLEHLWQWSLRDGGLPQGLAEGPLEMYDVEVDGDSVYLATPGE